MKVVVLVSVLFSLLSLASATLLIERNGTSEVESYLISQEWFDAAPVVLANISATMVDFKDENVTGFIVLMVTPNGLFEEMRDYILRCQVEGALAIIAQVTPGEATAGRTMFQTQIGTTKDIFIPFYTANEDRYKLIAKAVGSFATITPEGNDNFWKESNRSVFVQVWFTFIALFNMGVAIICAQRFYVYIKTKGWRLSTALVALVLNLIGLGLAIIHWAVDGDGTRQIYSRQFRTVILTISLPFIFSSCLLVILYWLELLTLKELTPVIIIRRLKIPYLVLSGYFIAFEVVSAAFRAIFWGLWGAVSTIGNIFINLMILIITIFVVISKTKKEKDNGKNLSKKFARMSKNMTAMAVLCILAVLLLGLYAYFQYQPWYSEVVLGLEAIVVLSIALTQVLMFNGRISSEKPGKVRSSGTESTAGSNASGSGGSSLSLKKSSTVELRLKTSRTDPNPKEIVSKEMSKTSPDSASVSKTESVKKSSSSSDSGSTSTSAVVETGLGKNKQSDSGSGSGSESGSGSGSDSSSRVSRSPSRSTSQS